VDEDALPQTATPVPTVKKSGIQIDEQLTKALEILKAKSA
jgi:hypothetical protein